MTPRIPPEPRTGARALRRLDDGVVALGLWVITAARGVRDFLAFAFGVGRDMAFVVRRPAAFREHVMWIGVTSLPLVAFISAFTGAVAAWQAAHNFADYVPLRYVGSAVGKSVMLELGPVLTALVVAGRAGAAMAAEIGTMAVTEQLDALRALGLKPGRLLYAPRVLAAMVALPLLTILSSCIALLGALAVVTLFRGMSPETFFFGVRLFYDDRDLVAGLAKALVFGGWIALFGCWHGARSTRGAEGVGRATMAAVVSADIAILVTGFVLSKLLLS